MLKLVYINNISIISIILQCDYSNCVNWKIIQPQRYLKTVDSQVFLQKDQGNSRFNYARDNATVENFLKNHLNIPDLSQNNPQNIYECY